MKSAFVHSVKRRYGKLTNTQRYIAWGVLGVVAVGVVAGAHMLRGMRPVDPVSYRPLLRVIADAESAGNYNAYFGNSGNTDVKFTDMTIAEVLAWQSKYIAEGSASSAVGRYQFLNTTLQHIAQEKGVSMDEKFDEDMQDSLAIALLERRGSERYVNQRVTRDEFAAELAKEWASLPKVAGADAQQSYYAGDGLNHALVSVSAVQQAVEQLRPL